MNYLVHSLAWSVLDFLAGVGLGYLIRALRGDPVIETATPRKDHRMTLRDRFSLRDLLLGLLVVGLSVYTLHLSAEQSRQRDCLLSYIGNNSDTQKVRSALVTVESQATRNVISSVLGAHTKEQVIEARSEYLDTLKRIDAGRDANPVQQFDESRCE